MNDEAILDAVKAERQKWLDKVIILADRENFGFPYLYYGCLICLKYNIDANQIKHADDCPARK